MRAQVCKFQPVQVPLQLADVSFQGGKPYSLVTGMGRSFDGPQFKTAGLMHSFRLPTDSLQVCLRLELCLVRPVELVAHMMTDGLDLCRELPEFLEALPQFALDVRTVL